MKYDVIGWKKLMMQANEKTKCLQHLKGDSKTVPIDMSKVYAWITDHKKKLYPGVKAG